jgi:hypothetical protein
MWIVICATRLVNGCSVSCHAGLANILAQADYLLACSQVKCRLFIVSVVVPGKAQSEDETGFNEYGRQQTYQ